jgi:hypothetical protein
VAERDQTELLFLVEEAPEGGFTARGIGEDIFTEADDRESLAEAVRDAVHCHLDAGVGPRLIHLHIPLTELQSPGA